MKYATILSLASLAFSVTAEPVIGARDPTLVGRQVATVTGVLNQVGSGIDSLDTAVKGYSGGDVGPVTSASSALESTIKAGTTTVSGSADLSLADALGLQAPVQALQTKAEALVSDLIAKKSVVEANGLCSVVGSQVSAIQSASNALISATVSKVPTDAQPIAQNLAAGFQSALAEASAAYATGNCTNTGGGSSSSSSSATSVASSSKASSSATSGTASSSSAASTPTVSSTVGTATSAGSVYPTQATASATSSGYASGTGSGVLTTPSTIPYTGAAANQVVSGFLGVAALAAALVL